MMHTLTLLIFTAQLFAATSPTEGKYKTCESCTPIANSSTQSIQNLSDEFMTQPLIIHPESTAIYGKDDRERANMNVFPYRTMGKLIVDIDKFSKDGKKVGQTQTLCTATLVGKCHLITGRHCVKSEHRFPKSSPCNKNPTRSKVTKLTFLDSSGQRHESEKIQAGPTETAIFDKDVTDGDYGFVKLKTSPGKKLGYMGVLRKSAKQLPVGTPIEVTGYNGDLGPELHLTTDRTGVIANIGKNKNVLRVRADSYSGSSGGASLAKADNGVPYIAGINSNAVLKMKDCETSQSHQPDDETQALAQMVASEAFFEKMKQFIRDNPCD